MLVHLPIAQMVKSLDNLAVECFICELWSNLQFNITVFLLELMCHIGMYEHVPIAQKANNFGLFCSTEFHFQDIV